MGTLIMRRAFLAATLVWVVALPGATFVMSHDRAPLVTQVAALAVYLAGSVVCHQLPGRTFQLWSHPMPVCARCTGIYFGAALAIVAAVVTRRFDDGSGGRLTPDLVRRSLVIAALPTLATIVFEWTTGETPSNVVRALAGIPLGGAVAWVIAFALAEGADARTERRGVV